MLIFAGLATRYACRLMFAFKLVATFTAHRFWSFADPAQFRAQQSQFFNNVSIFGAFNLIFAIAPGRCRRRSQPRRTATACSAWRMVRGGQR